jgi:hypothetical protein
MPAGGGIGPASREADADVVLAFAWLVLCEPDERLAPHPTTQAQVARQSNARRAGIFIRV